MLLLVRDLAQAVPRYFEGATAAAAAADAGGGGGALRNGTAEDEAPAGAGAVTAEGVDREMGRYLGNVAAFAAFRGPRLALRYEDLVAGPAAVATLAAFLGPVRAPPARAAALAAGYGELTEQCRAAGGREWLGVLRAAAGYAAGWPAAAVCRLGRRFGEAWAAAGAGGCAFRSVLEAYRHSAGRTLAACPGGPGPGGGRAGAAGEGESGEEARLAGGGAGGGVNDVECQGG